MINLYQFYQLYNDCFPLVRLSRKKSKNKKWVTPGVSKSSETKNRLYKTWITSKNSADKDRYQAYVRVYRKTLKAAEANYYSSTFNSKLHNSKYIWKEINNLCASGKRSSTRSNIAKIHINSVTISDPSLMASEFNKYFCNVGPNLIKQLPNSQVSPCFSDY